MLEKIRTFTTVVEKKSFAKAADALGLSPSVVTRRIGQLEKEVDALLIHRTTRQISLTEAGHIFYDNCIDIVRTFDSSLKSLQTLKTVPTGTLKIGMPVSISHQHITHCLAGFLHKNPNLKIHMVNGNHLMDLLSNGFDVVIHCGKLPNSSFHYRKLGTWCQLFCASPAYLKQHGVPKKPSDLTAHNCLDHYDNFDGTWTVQVGGQDQKIAVNGNVRVNSSIDLRILATEGIGIAFLPSFSVARELARGELAALLERYQPAPIDISAVYAEGPFVRERVRLFLDFLTTWAKSPHSGIVP